MARKPIYNRDFNTLTPEEQIKWLERQTRLVIKRLPALKKKLSVYDDRSEELYNLSQEEIQLFTKSYTEQISSGSIRVRTSIGEQPSARTKALEKYTESLQKYGTKPMRELITESTKMRWDSFLDNVKQCSTTEFETQYLEELTNKMSDRDIYEFTKSKLFFDNGNPNSADFVKFTTEHGISVGLAKLEVFLEQKGYDTKRVFYTEDTRVKLCRPAKRGRKRK